MNYRLAFRIFLFLGLGTFTAQAQISADNATVKGNNQFALELYQQLIKNKLGNLFISPYSVSSALAMTYAGAKGKTALEMANALHFPTNSLHADSKLLSTHLKNINGKGLQLSVANALWGQKKHRFLPDFLNLNKDYY